MGKYKTFVTLGIAIVIALIVSLLAYNWLQTKGKAKEVVDLETQPITVAIAELTGGTVLAKEMLKTTNVLKASFPGGFSDPSALVGRVLISNVKVGEPIFESKLAPTTIKAGGVAAIITLKKRAIAVKVDKTIGVAGFIHPGNRVDVLVTLPATAGKTLSEPITKTILENMLVLTVGSEVEPKSKEPSNVDVITLEGTPEETEKIALAAVEGKIQLALRNFGDSEIAMTKGATIPALLTSYTSEKEVVKKPRVMLAKKAGSKKGVAVAEEKKAATATAPAPFIVEVIKGGKVTEVKF